MAKFRCRQCNQTTELTNGCKLHLSANCPKCGTWNQADADRSGAHERVITDRAKCEACGEPGVFDPESLTVRTRCGECGKLSRVAVAFVTKVPPPKPTAVHPLKPTLEQEAQIAEKAAEQRARRTRRATLGIATVVGIIGLFVALVGLSRMQTRADNFAVPGDGPRCFCGKLAVGKWVGGGDYAYRCGDHVHSGGQAVEILVVVGGLLVVAAVGNYLILFVGWIWRGFRNKRGKSAVMVS